MKHLILGYARGSNKWQGLSDALSSIGIESDIVVENFDNIEGPYNQIWTMAESLLPLQAQLEEKWNINNVSAEAADILSNKKKMDDFCSNIGLKALIPQSVIPTELSDLDIFDQFIIKPTIGSGMKQNFDHKINYITYHNVDAFVADTYSELLFQVNQNGFIDKAFGSRTNYYMAQEYLPHTKLYAPYMYVNEYGDINRIFWVEGNIETFHIDKNRFVSRPVDFLSVLDNEVPNEVISLCDFYFETLVEELDIKSMFFAGPDFYYKNDLPIKIIDCNPRIGQGLQIINELNNNEILQSLLQNKEFTINNKILWKRVNLNPGKIKSVSDYSYLSQYITSTTINSLRPGITIPDWGGILTVPIALKIPGNTKTDMLETYRSISEQIQSCIIYD